MYVAQTIGVIALALFLLWSPTKWGRAFFRRRFAQFLMWANRHSALLLYHFLGYRYSLSVSATDHCLLWRRDGGLPHPVLAEVADVEVRRRVRLHADPSRYTDWQPSRWPSDEQDVEVRRSAS